MSSKESNPPESLCILRLSALGDVSHVLPVIHAIRHHWPQTRITWIIGRFEYKLVSELKDIEFIPFDKRNGWREYFALYRQLKGRKFDYLLLMQVALRANLASLAVRARRKIGYDHGRAKDMHGLFIDERIQPAASEHVVDSFFGFLRQAGLDEPARHWSLPITATARQFAATHLDPDRRTLLISPCSSHPRRNWHAEGYAQVADYAIERYDMQVVLCGGPSAVERDMGAAISAAMQHRPLNLIGKDTIQDFLGLLAGATLLLSPDSGPAHMATCTGTPVLGLYAASNPRRTGPYNSLTWCVDKYDEASHRFFGRPATQIKWGRKIEYPGVMDLITVEDVRARLDKFMQQADKEPTHD